MSRNIVAKNKGGRPRKYKTEKARKERERELGRNWYAENREKVCRKARERLKNFTEEQKEKKRAAARKYQRKRYATDSEYRAGVQKRSAIYQAEHPEKVREWHRNSYSVSPEKKLARNAVSRAVREGKMVRPDNCERCGKSCKTEQHHYLGYDKKNWMVVEWLCKSCHTKETWKKRR